MINCLIYEDFGILYDCYNVEGVLNKLVSLILLEIEGEFSKHI